MDNDKMLEVITIYREHFTKEGIDPVDFSHTDKPKSRGEILSHCHGMLDKMEKFIEEGRIAKTFRWIGFIQGCLWSTGQYTLEDLKNHSRPDIKNI